MKDRVVQHPARYQFVAVAGMTDTYDLVPVPGTVTEEGTLLNKSNLLSDATSHEIFGDTADHTVDDALGAVSGRIGDIKTTIRNDLPNNWLICNGDQISSTEYPEISELLGQFFENNSFSEEELWSSILSTSDTNFDYSIKCAEYINGYWVVGGMRKNNGLNCACIAYTTDLTSAWTVKDLWTTGPSKNRVSCIAYANGYWVVGGCKATVSGSTTTYYNHIAYATDLSGTWTETDLEYGYNAYNCINCITYANDYWVAGGQLNSDSSGGTYYAKLYYTTDPTGAWSAKTLWSDSSANTTVNKVAYAENYWVAVGCKASSDYKYPALAYATDLAGTWTQKTNLWASTNNKNEITDITYANGYWVGCGYTTGKSPYAAKLIYTADLSGTWTVKDLFTNDDSRGVYVKCIAHNNGYWLIGGQYYDGNTFHARILYTTDLDGEWTPLEFWSYTAQYQLINDIAFDSSGNWLLAGQYSEDNYTKYHGYIAYTNGNVKLPTITGAAYTYIKALEG